MSTEPYGIDAPLLADVAPERRRLSCGEFLFRQGSPTVGVFRLARGKVHLLRVTPNGSEVLMHGVRAGELFAEASLFSERYHCDALAAADSEILVYPKRALVDRLRDDPEALWSLAADLARRMQQLRAGLELRHTRSASERVMQFLRLHCGADSVYRVQGTLKEMARELGLTHEALYRALAALERQGVIERLPQAIRLP